MRGTDGHEVFHSTLPTGFGKQFWLLGLDSPQNFVEDVPLRARDRYHTSSSVCQSLSLSLSLPVRLAVFLFSGLSGSASTLYDVWSRGALTRNFLISFLQSDPSGLSLQSDAAGWYRPGYGAFDFVYTGSWSFEEAPGDTVAERRWWEAWLQWL